MMPLAFKSSKSLWHSTLLSLTCKVIAKKHVGALMARIGELEHLNEEKGKIEREDAISLS